MYIGGLKNIQNKLVMQSDLLKVYNDRSRPCIELSCKNKLFIAAVLDLFLLGKPHCGVRLTTLWELLSYSFRDSTS